MTSFALLTERTSLEKFQKQLLGDAVCCTMSFIVHFANGTVQLFDLENDLGEQNDLAESKPEIARKLTQMLHDWRERVDAKMPYPKTAT